MSVIYFIEAATTKGECVQYVGMYHIHTLPLNCATNVIPVVLTIAREKYINTELNLM